MNIDNSPHLVKSDRGPFFGSNLTAEMIAGGNIKHDEIVLRSETLAFSKATKLLFEKVIWLKQKGFVKGINYATTCFHDEPKYVCFTIAPSNETQRIGTLGVGKSFFDPAGLGKALGEIVERMSLFAYDPANTITASALELGDSAIALSDFAGVSNEERTWLENSPSFKKHHSGMKLTFDERTPFRWVRTTSLTSKDTRYIPLQLVSLKYIARDAHEPFIRMPLSTGGAAGATLDEALLAGVLEVIERDAYMIGWLNQIAGNRVDIHSSPKLREVADLFKRYHLELHIVELPTDFSIPVFLSIVIDRTGIGYAVVVGAKAGFDCEDVALDVACDIVHGRHAYRRQDMGVIEKDVHINLRTRAHLWRSVDRICDIEPLLTGPIRPLEYFKERYAEASSISDANGRLNFLKKKLNELNLDAYWVDVTAEQLHEIKVPVVMVSIPKMQPLYVDECFPYHGGERLKNVPQKLGLPYRKNPPEVSHPFA
jgi:ribosomal protein S12 methylthiotransferase accessory factor